jgi:hypothetical protein
MKKIAVIFLVFLALGLVTCKTLGQTKDPETIAKEAACNEACEKCKKEAKGDDAALILCDEAREECIKKANK